MFVYKTIWTFFIGKMLCLAKDESKSCDRLTVGILYEQDGQLLSTLESVLVLEHQSAEEE